MLRSTTTGQQHPGALPYPVSECHRCLNPMVARETSTQGDSSTGPMVPRSRPPKNLEEVSATMACQDACSPGTMSHSFLQDGLHQTCGSVGHPLQSQTSHRRLVDYEPSHMLLQILVLLQECGTQSFGLSLGPLRLSSPFPSPTRPCCHCGRIFGQQSLPVQEGISKPTASWLEELDQAQWSSFHAPVRYHRPLSPVVATTPVTDHRSHHKAINWTSSRHL